jgi:circadian clock protein KaiC
MENWKMSYSPSSTGTAALAATGIEGLDQILGGGLIPNRLYLVEGNPGTGKTTLALQFLLEGVKQGERVLYITLSETAEELQAVAASHGWSLEGISLFELSNTEGTFDPEQEMTLFHPWEVELGETVKRIMTEVNNTSPARVAFDSLSELRLLAQDPLRYRRQILAFKQFFVGRNCTVLMLDDRTGNDGGMDLQLHSISHGVITLERETLEFGPARRRIEIQKLRGSNFKAGWQDFDIRYGGLMVFPRLIALDHLKPFVGEPISSGLAEMDALLHGGPLRGTSTLITGPPGSAKTTLAIQYAYAAAKRGENVAIYEFDERIGTLLARSAAIGIDIRPFVDQGLITLRQIDPAELSAGEFTHLVRHEVEKNNVKMFIIDSIAGYYTAMPQERQLLLQLHELLSYLNQRGVVTFMLNPMHGLIGTMQTDLNISYIADTVILLRYFEIYGSIRKAISIIKNRGGGHENTIREMEVSSAGLRIGEPLDKFHGVLTGTPKYMGEDKELFGA